tara:strand:- start:712 stop:1095 length:384 start_codon:yes stop_codon:yes gene_type:complete
MKGYSPKLPLALDPVDGPFRLTKSLKEVVQQNLKMLILTSPGERVMVPSFGVGLYNYLFELNTQHTQMEIRRRINQQVAIYMPFVQILDVQFGDIGGMDADMNFLGVTIKYSAPAAGGVNLLRIGVD